MPKQVDHDRRRRELAEATCTVIAREGLDGTSLRRVSEQAGWSIGSMRYYFATRDELLVFALNYAGERIEQRLAAQAPRETALAELRDVIAELLPLDDTRREESLVWLAFSARASADPELAVRAEDVWRQLHEPFVEYLAAAVGAGELGSEVDAVREAARLHALSTGLVVHLLSAPSEMTPQRAMALVDDHLAALAGARD